MLQFIPSGPGHVEDRSSHATSVFVLNPTSFSCISCIKSRHVCSFSSLVFNKEDFIILKYEYTSLSLQSVQRNWCCNIKTTVYLLYEDLFCSTDMSHQGNVYFIACLMHKVKYKLKEVIG